MSVASVLALLSGGRLSPSEMEGAAVAQVCHERDVPLIVVGTISDKADHHVDFVKFVDTVASHFTCGIVRQFITEV